MCIFGDDPFEGALKPMAGRSVNRRRESRVTRAVHDIAESRRVPFLIRLVNASEKDRWPHDCSKFLTGKSVLTVEKRDFSAGFSALAIPAA